MLLEVFQQPRDLAVNRVFAQVRNLIGRVQLERHGDVVDIHQVGRPGSSNHALNHHVARAPNKVHDVELVAVELVGDGWEKWEVGGGSSLSCMGDAGGVSGNPPGGVGGKVGWELVPLAVRERSDIGHDDGCGGVCRNHHLDGGECGGC
jgi:hypothetical protein